jgi:hypothetical protein
MIRMMTRSGWVVGTCLVGLLMLLATVMLSGKKMQAAPAPAGKEDPFREALALVAKARAAYAKVQDYSCLMIKREKLEGKMSPDNVIHLQVRTSPFSVSMSWQQPKSLAGQEAIWVTGKNGGKMRGRPAGVLGALGFITVSLDDLRVRKNSRHPINHAGIGHLIEEVGSSWEAERKLSNVQVRMGAFTYAKKRCTRVEVIHSAQNQGKVKHPRSVLLFDQASHLPIRVENYHWSKTAGGAPELLEVFSYVNLRTNVGVKDEVFNK